LKIQAGRRELNPYVGVGSSWRLQKPEYTCLLEPFLEQRIEYNTGSNPSQVLT